MTDERAAHLAWTYLDTGRPERALEELAPLIAARPEDAELLVLGAQAAARSGDRMTARDLAGRAVAAAPEDVAALLVLSQVEAAAARWTDAARAATAAVRLAPADWRTHAQVVRVDLGAGTVYRSTIRAGEELLRLAPERVDARVVAGRLAAARHRRREAEAHFRAALAVDPDSGTAQEGLALLAAGRLRFAPAVETAGARLAADPTDRVGKRLIDAMTARLVVPAVLGGPFTAFALWRALRHADAGATLLGDHPFTLLLPIALAAWIAVQAVLLHRATRGAVWRDLRDLPGRVLGAVAAGIGLVTLVSIGVLATAPVPLLRTVMLVEGAVGALAFLGPLLAAVTGVLVLDPGGRGARRVRSAARRYAATEVRFDLPARARAKVLIGTALLAGPFAPGAAILAAGDAAREPILAGSLLAARPWTAGAVAIAVLVALGALLAAHTVSDGAVWSAVRRSRRFPTVVALAVLDLASVVLTVLALQQPVRLGGLLILLLLVVWTLVGCVVVLARSRSQRRVRRL